MTVPVQHSAEGIVYNQPDLKAKWREAPCQVTLFPFSCVFSCVLRTATSAHWLHESTTPGSSLVKLSPNHGIIVWFAHFLTKSMDVSLRAKMVDATVSLYPM